MQQSPDAPPAPDDVVRKLAHFRTGLPDDERVLLDALVAQATGAQPPPAGPSAATTAVPHESQEAFFRRLQAYRDQLPEPERPYVDAMVVEVGAAAPPDVEGHAIHWMKVGARSSWESYKTECEAIGPGFRIGKDVVSGTWGNWIPFTQQAVYTCFSP